MSQFQVNKTDFRKGKLIDTPTLDQLPIEEGEIIVKIDRFAYTSNNITYAVTGDMLQYWKFFPAIGDHANEEGVIPVWGFAEIVKSSIEELPEGDRLFGYFPTASFLKMKPKGITKQRILDGSEHRAQLPITYNLYKRVYGEEFYDKSTDNARMLLSPLLITAFLLWDLLKNNNWYDAQQILILSASSKTSIGLAYALHQDDSAPKIIGLTSTRNLESIANLKLYDHIYDYKDSNKINNELSTLIIDMSGNKSLLKTLYEYLGDQRKYTVNVGITHWTNAGSGEKSLSLRSEFFFAPSQLQKLIKKWGPELLEQKTSAFFKESATAITQWLNFEKIDGLEGLQKIHPEVCKGSIPPNKGLIIEL